MEQFITIGNAPLRVECSEIHSNQVQEIWLSIKANIFTRGNYERKLVRQSVRITGRPI